MLNSNLSKTERDKIFNTLILPFITNGLKSFVNPTAYILGGQPAVGKTYFIKKIIQQDKNIAIINGDDFRGYHPKYEYFLKNNEQEASDLIQEDINYWVEKAIVEISHRKYPMVVEGTFKNAKVPIRTAKLLKDAGYFVIASIILVDPEISKVDMVKRYFLQKQTIGFARFTKISAQTETVNKIFSNILEVTSLGRIDCLRLFRREIENYNLSCEKTSESDQSTFKKILDNEQKRFLSAKELDYIDDSWIQVDEFLKEFKKNNESDKLEDYVQEVKKIKMKYGVKNENN